jgi:putative membrane protein
VTLTDALPTVNASLNAASACALFSGYWAIRSKRVALHWKLMALACVCSTLFLAGYLTYHALSQVLHHYGGPWRPFYLVLLTTHTILAVAVLPLVLRTVWLSAVRRDYAAHRRIAVWTFPVWGYVSVTGVLVYWMLYRL